MPSRKQKKVSVGGLTIIPASVTTTATVGGAAGTSMPGGAPVPTGPGAGPGAGPAPVPGAGPVPGANGVPFTQPPVPQVGGMDPVSGIILSMNSNPYIIGMFMLLLNLGGRFLSLELTKKQEAFLQAPWIRPIIFMTVVFMATRNIVVAFWLTVGFFFIIWVVANEHSPFCMIPEWCHKGHTEEKDNYMKNIQRMFSTAKVSE